MHWTIGRRDFGSVRGIGGSSLTVLAVIVLAAAGPATTAAQGIAVGTADVTPVLPLQIGYNVTAHDPDSIAWLEHSHSNTQRIRFTANNIAPPPLPAQQITLASFIDRLRHQIVEDLRTDPAAFSEGRAQRHIDWGDVRCAYQGLTFDTVTRTCGGLAGSVDYEWVLAQYERAASFNGKAISILALIDATVMDGASEPLYLQPDPGQPDYYWTRWVAWRHYFVQGYYLAREHEITKFEFVNEPEASGSGWSMEHTLEHATLAGDAIQRAIETVNLLRGSQSLPLLVPNVMAAAYTSWNSHLNDMVGRYVPTEFYGRQLSTAWAFPVAPGGTQRTRYNSLSFHSYTWPLPAIPWCSGNPCKPAGLDAVYLTETNVKSAGAAKNAGWSQNSGDSVDRAIEEGRVVHSLGANGYAGGYFMKFGQAASNGLHWTTSGGVVGAAKRMADVIRIYAEGFAGAKRKSFSYLIPSDGNFFYDAAYEEGRQRYAVLSVNYGTVAKTMKIDVTALAIPLNSRVFVKHVSATSRGEIVGENYVVASGSKRVVSFTQPARSTVVTLIPTSATTLTTQPIVEDGYVRGGALRGNKYGTGDSLYAYARPGSVDNPAAAQGDRRVSYLKVNLALRAREWARDARLIS